MKRSKTAALLMMGVAPLLLTACDNEPATREGLYTSVDACVAQTNDSYTCKEAFAQAQKQAEVSSPRYASREECIAAHGAEQCEQRKDASGHSFFMPFMAGFMMSQMMRGGQPAGLAGAPAYRDSAGKWQRPAAAPSGGVYRSGGMASNAMVPVNAKPNVAPTVTRGGFGSSSSSRNSSGG